MIREADRTSLHHLTVLRLKSKSNILHMNLFLAFILRACVSFLIKLLYVNNLGLQHDVTVKPDGRVVFNNEGTVSVLITTCLLVVVLGCAADPPENCHLTVKKLPKT